MFSTQQSVGLNNENSNPVLYQRANQLRLISIGQFIKMKVNNWKYNRPADKSRIQPIMNYIKEYRRVEGIIYLAERDDIFYCYDGIHRVFAIISLVKQYQEYHDILGSSDILDIEVVLDIMPYNDEMIKERFININSSLPVPSIYTEQDQTIGKLQIVQSIWKYIETQYHTFVMSSRKTNVPNTNSTEFSDKFSVILDSVNLPEKTKMSLYDEDYWKTTFCQFNDFMKSRIIKTTYSRYDKLYSTLRMSKHQQAKCIKYDFYCFGSRRWEDYLMYFLELNETNNNL
jgi:hypothetical protein